MPEELGKIEKLPVDHYTKGRKLFFVPLILSNPELPLEFTIKFNYYWEQVDSQITGLEEKLGPVKYVFHELVTEGGEEGLKTLQKLNESGFLVVRKRIETGAVLEPIENSEILTELMDWSHCLALGLQSQKVFSAAYSAYNEVNKSRNESITNKIHETLKEDESALLIMAEGHHVCFPKDIQIFYVAPPALDDIKRWLRDYESKLKKNTKQDNNLDASPSQP